MIEGGRLWGKGRNVRIFVALTGVVLVVGNIAFCQIPPEEAQQRLNARLAAHLATAPSRAPAASLPPTISPPAATTAPAIKRYYAKPEAPEAIRVWIDEQPALRQAQIDAERTKLITIQHDCDERIASARTDLERIRNTSIPRESNGKRIGRSDWVDPAAEAQWKSEMDSARRRLSSAVRSREQQITDQRRVVASIESDPNPHMYNSIHLEEKVGSCGILGEFRIIQIIDGENMLIEKGELTYWLSDFKTDGLVDDQKLTSELQVIVATTRKYQRGIGSNKTVFEMQPIDIAKYVEVR
jgi:hypothetical protein